MSLLKNTKFWASTIVLLSIAYLAVILISIFGVRGDWIGIRTAFTTINYAIQSGILLLIIAVIIFVLSRKNNSSQIKSGVAIVLISIPLIAHYSNQPEKPAPGAPLNDISTDTTNPPLFEAVIPLRPEKSNTLNYPGESAALRQKELFPDIAPIESSFSTEKAFYRALEVAQKMNWEIVYQDQEKGIIEAVSSTIIFSFEDDVVIRIQQVESGSIIDIRSHSRIGRGDRGKNAQRVREFISQF